MDAPFGTSLIPKNVENTGENIVFDDVVLGRQCPGVAPMWGSTWAGVAPKRVQLLAKLRHVGPQVGANWSQVGPSWSGLKSNVSRKVCFWVGNLPFRPKKTSVFGRKRAFSICDAFVLKFAWKRNVSFTQPNILFLVPKRLFFAEKPYKKNKVLPI